LIPLENSRRKLFLLFEAFYEKTPIITPKKRTIQPGDAFEGVTSKLELEIVEF
jgi:hypothetical protein